MSKTIITLIVVIGGGALFAAILLFWGIGTYNRAKTLHNQIDAKELANSTIFDNTWKKISQGSQVTEAQKNALKDIFVGYANARSGGKGSGSFINAVKEAIPNISLDKSFGKLLNIITGSRDEWTANQVALVDMGREYNLMLEVFPSNILLHALGFEKVNVKLVTSTRTDEAFKSGKDDSTSLEFKQ